MEPINWPKSFTYAPTSIIRDIHPNFLFHYLWVNNDSISLLIETQSVHPHLQIKELKPPHPLAGKETFKGHVQHGLFALEKIQKNTELGEYVGEMCLVRPDDTSVENGVYLWTIIVRVNEPALRIYSGKIANELTFVNDYRGIQKKPNVSGKGIAHRGRCYFGYETIRDIELGEELLIDYGDAWAKHW